MNYEELLESRNGAAMAKESMPFGVLYKKMSGDKYVNVIDLRDDLTDSLFFTDALNTEYGQNTQLVHKNQLHFTLASDSAGLYGVHVEQGGYRTFERLLQDNPAVVASKGFIANVVDNLLDHAAYLHDKGIYHICYAPSNVLVRKSDNTPMLLFHGSSYKTVNDQQMLYVESAIGYVAPEGIEEGVFDARADIYSIGKFIEFLYNQSDVPFELRAVIKKATNLDPEKRYQTPEEMMTAIKNRKNIRSSIISGLAAVAIVAILLGLYFTLVPEREDIEFVKPAPKEATEELLDDGVDVTSELGEVTEDTIDVSVDERKMREFEAKAEQIFRKNYTREAERILSSIYNDERMNATEKNFMAGNQTTVEELVKAQVKMGTDAGLSDARSQLIAGQIIEQVSNKLKAQMKAKEENEQNNE